MSVDGLQGDLEEAPPPRSSRKANLEEYALALVGALDLAARIGGQSAFDSLFDRGFKRLYAWSYVLAGRNATEAEALTWDILLDAAGALARRGEARSSLMRDRRR
jgi:hypothetical protein